MAGRAWPERGWAAVCNPPGWPGWPRPQDRAQLPHCRPQAGSSLRALRGQGVVPQRASQRAPPRPGISLPAQPRPGASLPAQSSPAVSPRPAQPPGGLGQTPPPPPGASGRAPLWLGASAAPPRPAAWPPLACSSMARSHSTGCWCQRWRQRRGQLWHVLPSQCERPCEPLPPGQHGPWQSSRRRRRCHRHWVAPTWPARPRMRMRPPPGQALFGLPARSRTRRLVGRLLAATWVHWWCSKAAVVSTSAHKPTVPAAALDWTKGRHALARHGTAAKF